MRSLDGKFGVFERITRSGGSLAAGWALVLCGQLFPFHLWVAAIYCRLSLWSLFMALYVFSRPLRVMW